MVSMHSFYTRNECWACRVHERTDSSSLLFVVRLATSLYHWYYKSFAYFIVHAIGHSPRVCASPNLRHDRRLNEMHAAILNEKYLKKNAHEQSG